MNKQIEELFSEEMLMRQKVYTEQYKCYRRELDKCTNTQDTDFISRIRLEIDRTEHILRAAFGSDRGDAIISWWRFEALC